MTDNINSRNWNSRKFLFAVLAIFSMFYLRWFRLTPFVFLDDPTLAFVGSLILFFIYTVLSVVLLLVRHRFLKIVFSFLSVVFLLINTFYLLVHFPFVETSAKCNGVTYYITHGRPLFDEQWTYVQLSKWRVGFNYTSRLYGYSPGSAGNEIVCDPYTEDAYFFRDGRLILIDGEKPQWFLLDVEAQLDGNLYLVSEEWSIPEGCGDGEEYQTCDVYIYTLYKCKMDYSDCNPLPITYTNGDDDLLELQADEVANEVSLLESRFEGDNKTLIFTYGENSQCYVDSCVITVK